LGFRQPIRSTPADPLYQLVANAYDTMHRLSVETHYLSRKGVGRPSADGDEEEENGVVRVATGVNSPA